MDRAFLSFRLCTSCFPRLKRSVSLHILKRSTDVHEGKEKECVLATSGIGKKTYRRAWPSIYVIEVDQPLELRGKRKTILDRGRTRVYAHKENIHDMGSTIV